MKVILMALLLLCSLSAQAFTPKAEYKLTLNVGPQFYIGMGATKFAELVKLKTNGKINIKPYFGSSLLKGAQLNAPQMVATGAIDAAFDAAINIAPVVPELDVFSLPFLIPSYDMLDMVETGQTGRLLSLAMEAKGLKLLAWGENGFRQITNSKRAILTPADLKGLKIRVVGSPLFIDFFRNLGADPVNMNWGDAVAGFQQGVVDGQENPIGVNIPVQIWQYHKNITYWDYVIDPVIVYWNKATWESFPEDIKAAILAAATEAGRFEKALCRAGLDGQTSLNILKNEFHFDLPVKDPSAHFKAQGMTVTTLTDEQKNAFKAASQVVIDKWKQKIGPTLVESVQTDMEL